MPDWNGDGKTDWQDDYVINEIIPGKNDAEDGSVSHYSRYGTGGPANNNNRTTSDYPRGSSCSMALAKLMGTIILGIIGVIFIAMYMGAMSIISEIWS